MAVVGSATRTQIKGTTGNTSTTGKQRVIPYLVVVDSLDDTSQTVEAAPGLGTVQTTTYDVGNDADPNLILLSIRSEQDRNNPLQWVVYETYGPRSGEKPEENKPDESGETTNDPEAWFPEFSVSTWTEQVEATSGWNCEAWHPDGNGQNFNRAIDTEGPITNVLGERIDPPPFRTIYGRTLELVAWFKNLDHDLANLNNEGLVNDRNVRFRYSRPWVDVSYTMLADKHTLRVAGYTIRLVRQVNNVEYLECRARIDYNPEGWKIDVPNESLFERANAGDENNVDGSTFSAGEISSDRPSVQPQRANPEADDNILPVLRPIDLNGKANDDPLNLGYRVDGEIDFTGTVGAGTNPFRGTFIDT